MTMPFLEDAGFNPSGVTSEQVASTLGWINVKDQGAVGDNVHDDTAAIQASLDMVAAGGTFYEYPTLFFPHGAYKITSGLRYIPTTAGPTLSIFGQGSFSTAITLHGSNFGPTNPAFQIGDATHFVTNLIRGVIINGNACAYGDGTLTCVNGSTTVTGVGTDFTAAMVGKMIEIDQIPYRIDTVTNGTTLDLTTNFMQAGASGLTYLIMMGLNSVVGTTYGWRIFDHGDSRYDDMGSWYGDTGLKWEGLLGGVSTYDGSFNHNNIAWDGRTTVAGDYAEACNWYGGNYRFSVDGFKFDDDTNFPINLNWYGTETGIPAFAGVVWNLKQVQAFTISGCHTDVGNTVQSGRIVGLNQCLGGSIRDTFFAKGGSGQVDGLLFDAGSVDIIVESNHFRPSDASDVAIHYNTDTKRHRTGPNFFSTAFATMVTPVVDDSTAIGDDVNVYVAEAHP